MADFAPCDRLLQKAYSIHKHNSKCLFHVPTFILTSLAASYVFVHDKTPARSKQRKHQGSAPWKRLDK